MKYLILATPHTYKDADIGEYLLGEDWFILESEEAKDKFLETKFELEPDEEIYILEVDKVSKFKAEVEIQLKEVEDERE